MRKELIKKIVLLGDSAVGKTSLVRRFVSDKYDDEYISTIGAKVSSKEVKLEYGGVDYNVILMVWDIIGSQGYESTQASHIAGLNGAILVTDLSRPETKEGIEKYWMPLLSEITSDVLPPMIFFGNKADLIENKDEVSQDEGASEHIKDQLFTSAKTGENVEDGFRKLVAMMVKSHYKSDPVAELMDKVVADGMYEEKERNTPQAILDMIVADFSQVAGSVESSRKILQGCVAQLEISKDNPSIEDLNNLIDFILKQSSDRSELNENKGLREYVKIMRDLEEKGESPRALIDEYRKKWLKAIEGLEN